jgi:23S rRNA (uracil1939-C5)-methyltransferase
VSRKNKNIILKDIAISDYAAEGKSLGRVEGKVIFVENTVPGDVVDVQITKNKKDWAEGWAKRFVSYSPERVTPFCQHFGICGGCQWQMLPYDLQLKYKTQQVKDNLTRLARIPLPEIQPILGCEKLTRYRNKMEYTFSNKKYLTDVEVKDETVSAYKNVAGFHAKGVFDKVVEIETCHLQEQPTNEIRNSIANYARENGLTFYDIRQHEGFLRTMQVRLARTGELMVNIVFGFEDKEKREALLNFVLQKFPQITTLLYTINTKMNDSLYDLHPKVFKGKGFIIETLEKFQFKVSPKSFFQTNTEQGEKLYQLTREFAELKGTETVYDLYCGTGSIGIFLSDKAKKIIGVETVSEAIEDAKENAKLNNIEHASFFCGDVIKICDDDFFAANGKPDVIITDPPRAGMHEKLVNKLLDMEAPLIVYVSCNPATQARDLQLLSQKYTVTRVQPVDMFPHTLHIENIAQLKLKKDL